MTVSKFIVGLKNNKIVKNFSYLSLIHIINLLIPLLLLPYLIKVLGKDLYGLIAFIQAIVLYVGLIINFGFYTSATKSIAQNVDNPNNLSEIICSVYLIKIGLCLLTFFVYLLIILIIPFSRDNFWLFFFSFGYALQDLLLPTWYYQGIEQMKYITLTNLISRIILLMFTFLLVKSQNDYLLVPVLNAIGIIIGASFSIYMMVKKSNFRIQQVPIGILKKYFFESVPLFISSFSISMYVNAGKIITGYFLNMSDVAIYDVIEKTTKMLRVPVTTFGQATFPQIVKKCSIGLINRYMLISLLISMILLIVVTIFSDQIVYYFLRIHNIQAIRALFLANFSIIFVAFSYFLGTNRLVAFGYNKIFTKNIIFASIAYFLYLFILYVLELMNLVGIASALTFVEIITMILMAFSCRKLSLLTSKI